MAKKKLRYKRKKKRLGPAKTKAYDYHHLCWERRHWNRGGLKSLRQFHYCIIKIERDTLHKFLHSEGKPIPPPSESSALEVLRELRLLEDIEAIDDLDPIEKRLSMLAALFDGVEPPTSDAFKKQLQLVHRFKKPPR